jgi:hypothetical protein
MTVKTLIGRLRRLEAKTGASSLEDFFSALSDVELEAYLEAIKLPVRHQASELSEQLGWPLDRAQTALEETDRLAERQFFGWSDDRMREHLETLCADDCWREQFAIWLEEP